MHTELAAEWFVRFFVAVDSCYFGETGKVLGCFFVGRLEVLAVATPGGIEFDDLEEFVS